MMSSTSSFCECSQELRRVLLIKNSPSWQGLNDALDEICSFEIPTERFCCREAVVRSGAVQLIVDTMLAGGWEGQRRKRTHRDPPPHDRDEMAAKAANSLGVLCAPRQTVASQQASQLLELKPNVPAPLQVDDDGGVSELCRWLYDNERGEVIVDGLVDLVEQSSEYAQADALFALSWLLHIDSAERVAVRRKIIPRISALLKKQCAALTSGVRVSEATESVRVFALVCLSWLVRSQRESPSALSPTARTAFHQRVQSQRLRKLEALELAAAERKAEAERAIAKLSPRSRRRAMAEQADHPDPEPIRMSESPLPEIEAIEGNDARCHRLQHELISVLPELVPTLLAMVAHVRSHQTLLLVYDVLCALAACEPSVRVQACNMQASVQDYSPCSVGADFRPTLFHLLFSQRAVFLIAAHKSHPLPSIATLARYMLEALLSDEARAHSRLPMDCSICRGSQT